MLVFLENNGYLQVMALWYRTTQMDYVVDHTESNHCVLIKLGMSLTDKEVQEELDHVHR